MNAQAPHSKYTFDRVLHDLDVNASYEALSSRIRGDIPDIERYRALLAAANEKERDDRIRGFTRTDIETILIGFAGFFDTQTTADIIPLIRLRYRRYIFRIIYLLWQDYYDKPEFQNLFLYTINHPKTIRYADEVHFTAEQLRFITLSEPVDRTLLELARKEERDMPEFLSFHKIRRDSVLAIDAAGILFLFCSAEDYLQFGPERLLIAIMRLEMANRAKVLNNMVKKLSAEQRQELKEVFIYYLYTYYDKEKGPKTFFWNYVFPEVRDKVFDEFMK